MKTTKRTLSRGFGLARFDDKETLASGRQGKTTVTLKWAEKQAEKKIPTVKGSRYQRKEEALHVRGTRKGKRQTTLGEKPMGEGRDMVRGRKRRVVRETRKMSPRPAEKGKGGDNKGEPNDRVERKRGSQFSKKRKGKRKQTKPFLEIKTKKKIQKKKERRKEAQ